MDIIKNELNRSFNFSLGEKKVVVQTKVNIFEYDSRRLPTFNERAHATRLIVCTVSLFVEGEKPSRLIISSEYTMNKTMSFKIEDFLYSVASDLNCAENTKGQFLDEFGATQENLKIYKQVKRFKRTIDAQLAVMNEAEKEAFSKFFDLSAREELTSSQWVRNGGVS